MRPRLATTLSLLWLLCACARFQEGPSDVPVPPGTAFVEVDGWKIHARTVGEEGDWVVLLHGYSASHLEWMQVVPALCSHFRCLLLDLPGFGWSDKRKGDYSPARLARFVDGLMAHFGIESAHVVAHSWGASVALALAHDFPGRVRKLALVGAWVYAEQLPTFFRWARARGWGELLFTLFFDEQIEARYELVYFEPNRHIKQEEIDALKRFMKRKGVVRAALQAARDQRFETMQPWYREVTNETLLLWGEEDRVSDPFFGRRLAAELPDSSLRFMPRCGHLPHHENPDGFLALLLPFLREAPP
jgi:pimeloyl-ACP methyl ester carboxylesterase